MKKSIAKEEAFEEALSRYAEAYAATLRPPNEPADEEAELLTMKLLISVIDGYCGRKRGRRSLRITVKL